MAITSVSNKTVNKREKLPIKQCGSPWNKRAQLINLVSYGTPNAISSTDTVPVTILDRTKAISDANSYHSHCSALLLEGALWQWLCEAVGEHLSSPYVAPVNLSISSHICSKIILGHNVCNCSSMVDSVLDARDQWLWIREHVRDSRDAQLIQEMWDLWESLAAYSEGIVFGIGRGLGSQLL